DRIPVTSAGADIPVIAKTKVNANGDFVVTWETNTPVIGGGVFARPFDNLGNAAGPAFRVNDGPEEFEPDLAMSAGGDFVIAMTSWPDGGISTVRQQRFANYTPPQAIHVATQTGESILPTTALAYDVSSLVVQFTKNMASSGPGSVTNPANYQLLRGSVD